MRGLAAGALAAASLAGLAACGSGGSSRPLAGGDPKAGERLIEHYGCGACHTIPGVTDADGRVAPSLDGFAKKQKILGAFPNTPANLTLWIENPQRVAPGTRMPGLGVTRHDARQIAAYLLRKT